MRQDIAFKTSDGTTLRGWHYLPDGAGLLPDGRDGARFLRREGDVPRQVCRGLRRGGLRVRRLRQPKFRRQRRRAAAGDRSLAAGPRLFGRGHFRRRPPETDASRIGVWGSSYSGAHVLVVAAIDRRVKCVVSQVPAISGSQGFRRFIRPDFMGALEAQFHADRTGRAAGEAPAMIPVVAADPTAPSALPTSNSYTWFTETAASRAPSWRNEVTLRTLEYGLGYEPGSYIGLISPTPLLLIVALKDHLAVSDLAIAAYERAYEPKKLVLLPGGHFDAYIAEFDQSSGPAVEWFRAHL